MNLVKSLKLLGLAALGGVFLSVTPLMTACTTTEVQRDTVVVPPDTDTVVVIPPTDTTHPFDQIACLQKASPGKYNLKTTIGTSCTLPGDSTYYLQGLTFVNGGATLTIGAGATFKGKYPGLSALIIDKGAKLMAVGTAVKPIVFTSGRANPQRGDFGGVILIGNGITNLAASGSLPAGQGEVEGLSGVPYGGGNNADNSGELKYVRIEYAGYLLSPNNELNGLTMAGVGSGTQISYVQVYEGFDDGFEWFGGAVNADHLVVMGCDDDMFDWDFGWAGTAQFLLGVHNGSTNNDANGIEADGNANGHDRLPLSAPKVANVTLMGNNISVGNGSLNGMRLRRGTAGNLYNVLVTGFRVGRAVRIDDNSTIRRAAGDTLKIQSLYAYGNGGRTAFTPAAGLVDSATTMANLTTKVNAWFTTDTASAGIISTGYSNFKPTSNLAGATTLPSGFTAATYIGAFDPAAPVWTGDSTTAWFRKF